MLTCEQQKKLEWALNCDTNYPKFTDDPQVNFEVDKLINPERYRGTWETLTPKEKERYYQEIREVAEWQRQMEAEGNDASGIPAISSEKIQ